MLLGGGSTGVGRALPANHPVAGVPHADVPIALLAAAAFVLVLMVGLLLPRRTASPNRLDKRERASWEGALSPAQWVIRGMSLAVLVLGVIAGRVGADNELENLAPALIIGAGWPLVFLGGLLVPGFWRWLDPWDTVGRMVNPSDRTEPADDVRPAIVLAVAVLWYLAVFPQPLDPRAVGAVLAAYTVVTTAGCIIQGRRRWLSTGEPIGFVLNRLSSARPGRALPGPEAQGAAALLGMVAGGTLFAALFRTDLWSTLVGPGNPMLTGTLGLVACCAAGAALAELQVQVQVQMTQGTHKASRRSLAVPLVALGLAPAVAGIVVSVAMDRNRLSNSLQLLPGLAGDPFGEGWDRLGDPSAQPLGPEVLLTLQLSVLVLTHLWGAVLVARRADRQARLPAVLLLGQLVAAGVAALSLY